MLYSNANPTIISTTTTATATKSKKKKRKRPKKDDSSESGGDDESDKNDRNTLKDVHLNKRNKEVNSEDEEFQHGINNSTVNDEYVVPSSSKIDVIALDGISSSSAHDVIASSSTMVPPLKEAKGVVAVQLQSKKDDEVIADPPVMTIENKEILDGSRLNSTTTNSSISLISISPPSTLVASFASPSPKSTSTSTSSYYTRPFTRSATMSASSDSNNRIIIDQGLTSFTSNEPIRDVDEFIEFFRARIEERTLPSLASSSWSIGLNLLGFFKNFPFFFCICNIANAFKRTSPAVSLNKRFDYIKAVRDCVISFCSFKLSFAVSNAELDSFWNMTPANGFCFYLMNYQARLCFLKHDGKAMDALPESFQYDSKEFRTEVDLEIKYIKDKMNLNVYVDKSGYKSDDNDILKQLQALKSYDINKENARQRKKYSNVSIKTPYQLGAIRYTWEEYF
jgi:hypothetical protein